MKEIISLASGRTCLFGDHQDYLGLPVIACAINRNIKLTAVQNVKDAVFDHVIQTGSRVKNI
jgi:galactokinase